MGPRKRNPSSVAGARAPGGPVEVDDGNSKPSKTPAASREAKTLLAMVRPFHTPQVSPFSHTESGAVSYRGLLNLAMIVLVLGNFRLVIENLMKYGLRMKFGEDGEGSTWVAESATLVGGVIGLYVFFGASFLLMEKLALSRSIPNNAPLYAGGVLSFISPFTAILLANFLDLPMLPRVGLLVEGCILGMKLFSYCHLNSLHRSSLLFGVPLPDHSGVNPGSVISSPENGFKGAPSAVASDSRVSETPDMSPASPSMSSRKVSSAACLDEDDPGRLPDVSSLDSSDTSSSPSSSVPSSPPASMPSSTSGKAERALAAMQEEIRSKISPVVDSAAKQAGEAAERVGQSIHNSSVDFVSAATVSEVTFPHNLTPGHITYFFLAPTLVYDLNYPRTKHVRWEYVVTRGPAFVLCLVFLIAAFEQYMIPGFQNTYTHLLKGEFVALIPRLLKLAVPNIGLWLVMFYTCFHLGLNVVAELLCFADRGFYSAWWNSTTVGDFWRLWNRPVHLWMVRHLFLPLRHMGYSRNFATLVVFLMSAYLHELVASAAVGSVMLWAFFGMMAQVPLIHYTRHMKGRQLGNVIFWVSLMLGQPLLMSLYYVTLQ